MPDGHWPVLEAEGASETDRTAASVAERYPARSLDAEREETVNLLQAARRAGEWTLWSTRPPVK